MLIKPNVYADFSAQMLLSFTGLRIANALTVAFAFAVGLRTKQVDGAILRPVNGNPPCFNSGSLVVLFTEPTFASSEARGKNMMSHNNKLHVCPWWIGYFLLIPWRRFIHDSKLILSPYVREGMIVLEVGPGMGYFSLTLAQLVGPHGRVICVDVQEKMLEKLKKRAQKTGMLDRITAVRASEQSLHLQEFEEKIDFAFAFAVVHEVPDQLKLFEEIHRAMRPGALLLLSEPRGHVTGEAFEKTLAIAQGKGFNVESNVQIKQSHAVLLRK
jgi:SAM-dependent methyltransferase